MKKKITYTLISLALIASAFYIGRNTAPHTTAKTIHTMPEKVDLSDDTQFNYIDTFFRLYYRLEYRWKRNGNHD